MNQKDKFSVMIVEDYFVVRVGLAAIINSQSDMFVVAESSNGREAIELFDRHQPEVTLLDLRLTGMNGLEVLAAITKRYPKARVIVLSTHAADEDIFRAFQSGARAYFLKDINGPDLVSAIRAVRAGQRPVPAEIAARLAARIPRSALSPRELEILRCISSGNSNKEIATNLKISAGTVRVHASNIFAKLGCSDRAQAVTEAFKRGIIYLE